MLLEESLSIVREIGDHRDLTGAFYRLGLVHWHQGDYEAARRIFGECLAASRASRDLSWTAALLATLAHVAMDTGDHEAAQAYLEESLAVQREVGDEREGRRERWSFGWLAALKGDYATARLLLEESLARFRELRHKSGVASMLAGLGTVAILQGDHTGARCLWEESLALGRELGRKDLLATCLTAMAGLASGEGEAKRAARLLGAAAALRDAIAARCDPLAQSLYEHLEAATRAQLGEAAFAVAWEAGRALTLGEALAWPLEELDTDPGFTGFIERAAE